MASEMGSCSDGHLRTRGVRSGVGRRLREAHTLGGAPLRRGSFIQMLSSCTADNRVTSSDNRIVPHKSVRMVVAFGLELVIGWIDNSHSSVTGYLTK